MIQLYLETKVYIYGPKLSDSSQVVQNYLSFYTGSYEYKNTYKFLVLQEIYMCFSFNESLANQTSILLGARLKNSLLNFFMRYWKCSFEIKL